MLLYFATLVFCIGNIVLVSGQTYICENSVTELKCPSGQVINVTNASYGRENATICSNSSMPTNCTSQNVTEFVSDLCSGAQNCEIIFSEKDFENNPCANVTKYITVDYKCNNFTPITCGRHEHYSSIVCDCINQCQTPDFSCSEFCSFSGGCTCNHGYKRDPITKKCVGEAYCPQSGNLNATHEIFNECANHQSTCRGRDFLPWFPRRRCVPGYECAPGYVRDTINSECVTRDECPRGFPRG